MRASINDGGPAFPLPIHKKAFDTTPRDFVENRAGGMTLRDYFAAAALPQVDLRSHGTPDDIALECYQLADAMLKAREAK
jgi:hypothetical protein